MHSAAYMLTTESDEHLHSCSLDSDGSPKKNGRKFGESKDQFQKRIDREKEKRRLEKLMRYAYPRQRETYMYKKKLLPPSALNMSVDLLSLKKE